MAKQKKNVSELGYAEAIAELEEILELLDGDDVDVDQLSTHVQRADELIELCRERISSAKLRIEEVVGALKDE
jgi:exodeoxyribonuclease VII small subunit